jgi:pyruvate dehydrogenase (quinone)
MARTATDVPVVIDAVFTADVAPIPPHVEWEQAKAIMSALMKGDPDAGAIVRRSARQEMLGWLPGRG